MCRNKFDHVIAVVYDLAVQTRNCLKYSLIWNSTLLFGEDLCLKYYRAPRYPVRCVMIVLVELGALIAQIKDLHFSKQR